MSEGSRSTNATLKLMHTTMQTLGRVAIIGGGILVAMVNVYVFAGVEGLPQAEIVRLYKQVYLMALVIPFISVLGVGIAWFLQRRHMRQLRQQGFAREQTKQDGARPREAWWSRPSRIGGFWEGASPLSCSR